MFFVFFLQIKCYSSLFRSDIACHSAGPPRTTAAAGMANKRVCSDICSRSGGQDDALVQQFRLSGTEVDRTADGIYKIRQNRDLVPL